MATEAVIETRDLTKFYGPVRGLEGVSLAVARGELYGFLGPNGAGKTTMLRLLLDLLRPTRGAARVFGLDTVRESLAIRARLGYAPAELDLYPDATGAWLLHAFARLRPGRPPVLRDAVLDLLGLSAADLGRKVGTYSTGMKRKLVLTLAVQHDPDLLVLDEPTVGLDPIRKRAVLAFLEELRRRGRTVFFSSHNLPEVESVCDRVGIVNQGRLVAEEHIEELRRRQVRRVEVTLAAGSRAPAFEGDGLEVEEHAGRRWVVKVRGAFDPLIRGLQACRVETLVAEPPRLEDAFFEYYRQEGK